jgi:hypothetical protein
MADIAAARDGGDVYAHADAHEAAEPPRRRRCRRRRCPGRGDVYAHADAHEAADPAAAAAAAAASEAEAAELRVIRAEVHHHADAMSAYLNALFDENARMVAVPFGRRGGARDGLLRTGRNGR